jgi:hypothetical protein
MLILFLNRILRIETQFFLGSCNHSLGSNCDLSSIFVLLSVLDAA